MIKYCLRTKERDFSEQAQVYYPLYMSPQQDSKHLQKKKHQQQRGYTRKEAPLEG